MIEFKSSGLAIFRDDLFPLLGGGNKARKMMSLDNEIKAKNYGAIVTTGGIQSNHCRAVSLYCEKNKIECTLVIHGDKKIFLSQSGNAKIMRNTSSNFIFCKSEEIAFHMENTFETYFKTNKNPLYIPGGGHIEEAAYGYLEVIEKIKDSGYLPDYIFVASGTGSTHAGILAGIAKHKLLTKVYGISVGRTKERGQKIVENFYERLCKKYNIEPIKDSVFFLDDFLCGGYGKYNKAIEKIEKDSILDYNLFMDKTYTAKVFYAMEKIIEKEALKGRILFWYTGGVFNYLA